MHRFLSVGGVFDSQVVGYRMSQLVLVLQRGDRKKVMILVGFLVRILFVLTLS